MTAGIVVVAFGNDYAAMAAQALKFSRKNTDLPFHVLTNVNNFKAGGNTTVRVFEKSQRENRKAKLRANEFSPFDLTLLMDCDSVIQRKGCELFIDLLDGYDTVFNNRITFIPGQPIWNIYRRTMDKFGVKKPITISSGGLFAFRKNDAVDGFFKTWYQMWEQTGCGREMPALNCAIKKTELKSNKFPKGYFVDNAFSKDAIIQHCWNQPQFCTYYGFANWKPFKPFDKGGNDDFRFERNPI